MIPYIGSEVIEALLHTARAHRHAQQRSHPTRHTPTSRMNQIQLPPVLL
jgi:hypothetical protein